MAVVSVEHLPVFPPWHAAEASSRSHCRALQRRFGPCEPESLKDRMKRAVALLGKEEVNEIVRSQGKIEVRPCALTAFDWRRSCTDVAKSVRNTLMRSLQLIVLD